MAAPILTTKLYILPPRPGIVLRPRLVERLNAGLGQHRLTLVSASAGSGKTTLLGEWIAVCGRKVAWLSLVEGDIAPALFLTYLIAALQTISPDRGTAILPGLQSPQPTPIDGVLAGLLNEIAAIPEPFIIVL